MTRHKLNGNGVHDQQIPSGALDDAVGATMAQFEERFGRLTREDVERIEAAYEGADPSPVVATFFGGAAEGVVRLRTLLGREQSK